MIDWLSLSDDRSLKEAIRNSFDNTVFLFKHSARCGLSGMILNRLNQLTPNESAYWYQLDLIAHRQLSDRVAADLNVNHESPQLLILSDGQVAAHYSHLDIRAEVITDWLKQAQKKDPIT